MLHSSCCVAGRQSNGGRQGRSGYPNQGHSIQGKIFFLTKLNHGPEIADNSVFHLINPICMLTNIKLCCLCLQARATLHFDGWAYNVGDFNVRVGKVTLRPREEFKGFMVEVEYTPVSTAEQATPALQVSHPQ